MLLSEQILVLSKSVWMRMQYQVHKYQVTSRRKCSWIIISRTQHKDGVYIGLAEWKRRERDIYLLITLSGDE